ncbi:MAG: PEGA domain-containing protein [Minicystis sp.]
MRRLDSVVLGAALTAAGVALSVGVRAQSAEAPAPSARVSSTGAPGGHGTKDDPKTIEARKYYLAGLSAAKLGRWQDAYRAYLSAWTLKRHWQLAGNLGRAELEVGMYPAAVEHLAIFLREAEGVSPEEIARVQGWLDEAKSKVGTLRIETEEPSAEILLNGAPQGREPLGDVVYVEPGKHAVEARLTGCTARRDVEVEAGRAVKVVLRCPPRRIEEMPPLPPPPAQTRARTAVLAVGGATAGSAFVAGVVFAAVLKVKADAADQLKSSIEPNGPNRKSACVGTPPGPCTMLRNTRDEQYLFRNLAFWSFVGAGVVGAGTLIYGLAAPGSAQRGGMQAAPVVMPGGGGVVLTGTW